MARGKRLKLGDVIEFRTSSGFGYAQYVNFHSKPPRYGWLMRILPGIHEQRLADLTELVAASGSYCCFWFVNSNISAGSCRIVGNWPIPKEHQKIPFFKWGIANLKTGMVKNWKIWNPKNRGSKPVEKLTEEQKKFPILQIVSLEVVIERLENDWHPELACQGRQV